MSAFVDTTLVRLSTPEGLRQLISPAADVGHQRIRALFAAVYQLPFAVIHEVLEVTVASSECMRPVFAAPWARASWLQTLPGCSQGEVRFDGADVRDPHWIDVSAEVDVNVVLEVDPAEVDTVRLADVGEFSTLEEFRERFGFLDLDAFMAEHHLTTVGELRGAFRYLLGEVRLKPVPPFDPADRSHQRRFGLSLAVLVREAADLAAAAREMRLLAAAAEQSVTYRRELGEAEVRAPFAPVLVLPEGAVAGTGLTQEQVVEFFAKQQVLTVFETD